MSQPPSVEPANRTQLNPVLQAALASLDVRLEDELARYRRQRAKTAPKVSPPTDVVVPEGKVEFAPPPPRPPEPDPAPAPAPPEPEAAPAIPPASGDDSYMAPDDYLESSERLLEKLDESEKAVKTDRTLLNPIGVGSVLVFLLLCATAGYVAMNPESLQRLGWERWFGREEPETAATDADAPEAIEPEPAPEPVAEAPTTPNGPDLTSPQFRDLELDDLPQVDPEAEAIDVPTPAPQATAAPSTPNPNASPATPAEDTLDNLSREILEDEPETEADSDTEAEADTETDSAAEVAVDLPDPIQDPNYGNFHYVLVPVDRPRTYEQAREVVPDAYLREFPSGVKIQMGAFATEEDARALVDRLQKQGITAEIYQAP